jgi:hypothetical protein
MRVASEGIDARAAGPTLAIRPSRTITVWFSRTRSRSMGITETPTKAVVWPPATVLRIVRAAAPMVCRTALR